MQLIGLLKMCKKSFFVEINRIKSTQHNQLRNDAFRMKMLISISPFIFSLSVLYCWMFEMAEIKYLMNLLTTYEHKSVQHTRTRKCDAGVDVFIFQPN